MKAPRVTVATREQLASVAHFARLSRAFLLMDLFRRFNVGGPIGLDGVIRGLGLMRTGKA